MVDLAVNSPKNEPVEGTIREIFPLRNYVFFSKGSTEIPDRYVILKKDEVADFNEFEPEVYAPNELAGRSDRQLLVYYNILNIIGDRMVKNPNSKITLVGSSEKGKQDGIKMAASIKTYLVTVFEIDSNRIALKGQVKPTFPTEGGEPTTANTPLEGDRRVAIETKSPELLISFKTGEESVLKPVVVSSRQTAPLNSYVSFKVNESEIPISNWKLKLTDSLGRTQSFGPFESTSEEISGDKILGDAAQGTYDVEMTATLEDGQIVKQDTTIRVIKWKPEINQKAMRYSIIFDYNQALVIPIYVNYLKNEIVPKIPMGGTISIQGYADAIGNEEYNQKLSLARAKNVEKILRKELNKNGRNDVTINVVGFGEDLKNAQFDNKFPEERYYNRSVIIDIAPKK